MQKRDTFIQSHIRRVNAIKDSGIYGIFMGGVQPQGFNLRLSKQKPAPHAVEMPAQFKIEQNALAATSVT